MSQSQQEKPATSQRHRYSLGSHVCLQIISVKKALLNSETFRKPEDTSLLVHISTTLFSKDDLQAGQGLSQKYEETIWKEGVLEFQLLLCLSKRDHVSIPQLPF